jgi:hypothetical protein
VHALRDLELDVARDQLVLTDAAGLVRQRGRRNQQRVDRGVARDRGRLVPDHRGVALWGVHVVVALVGRGVLGLGEGDTGQRAGGEERHSGPEKPLPAEFRHD